MDKQTAREEIDAEAVLEMLLKTEREVEAALGMILGPEYILVSPKQILAVLHDAGFKVVKR